MTTTRAGGWDEADEITRDEPLGVKQIRDVVCGDCPWQLAELRTLGE